MSLFFIIKTEVSPPNVYVSMGSTLELNCTIEKDYSPYRLMFIFNQKEVHPPESSRAQNNSIVLRKDILKTLPPQKKMLFFNIHTFVKVFHDFVAFAFGSDGGSVFCGHR